MDDGVKPVSSCSRRLHLTPLVLAEEFFDPSIVPLAETLFWHHPSGVELPIHVVSKPAQCILF